MFAELTGHDAAQWEQAATTAPAGRLVIIALATVVTAYEHAISDAEGRSTWRTDRYSPCPRPAAAAYLTFLASLGYQLSAIEQAVAEGRAWTGDPADGGHQTAEHDARGAVGQDRDVDSECGEAE